MRYQHWSAQRRRKTMRGAMKRILNHIILLLLVVLPIAAGTAGAAPQKTTYSTIDLISEQASLPAAGGDVTLGLYVEPDPTWHAYWSNPGDAGLAPRVEWQLPDGFEVGEFVFPAPHLLPFGELNTYGFEEPILLLATVSVPAGLPVGSSVELGGAAHWLVCDDKVCVPDRATVSLTLPVGDGATDAGVTDRFAAARAKLPQAVDWPAQFSVADGKVSFEIVADPAPASLDDAYLFVESKILVQYGTQAAGFSRNGLSFVMDAGRAADEVDATAAVLTLGESGTVRLAFERADGPLRGAAAPATGAIASDGGLSFGFAVLFAFLGGIILNLMPCVFPILSMKALGLVNTAQHDQRVARESGVIYTFGILVAFAAIGAALLAIRSAGEAVGWGFQLQNPLVNAGLGLLMVLIGMNLFGVFEIGTRIMGAGQGLTEGGERRAAFFTGLLAVVVATPCTAPFMAGALGYALAQPALIAMSVFLALGFGLAFPYLLLSFVPQLGRLLPKPGPWMETFKHVLAFPMLLTAVWLFWVVGKQLGATSMTMALLAALALAFAAWCYGKAAMSDRAAAWYVTALVSLAACGFAFLQIEPVRQVVRAAGDYSAGTLGGLELERFDAERVSGYIADGQPTFVYFTADWCISCKANERVALSTDTVAEAINSRGIKVIEGDWTMEDPVITEWLEMYDRAGVPLYLYFPSGSSLETVTILPQILTPGIVIDAIVSADAAAGTSSTVTAVTPADEVPEPLVEEFVLPDAAPDWSVVQAYIDVDEAWHAAERDARGEHPDIVPAQAAATAIAKLDGEHPQSADAARFLVEHTIGAPGGIEAMRLGLDTLLTHHPDFDDWPPLLFATDFYTEPGVDVWADQFLEDFEFLVKDQPVAAATARYYSASRNLRLANAVATSADERAAFRTRAVGFATGLSKGVESAELVKRRRFTDDGEPIPFPTLGEAEKDLLYNLQFLTVGSPIPDVSAPSLDGVVETVSTYRGQAVLLDFWATWCGPCIDALPTLNALNRELPVDEFEILSISVDEFVDTVTEFHEDNPMPWANWHVGPKGELLSTWAVRGYPTYILIDHNGAIVARQHDLNDEFQDLIRATACGPTGHQSC